MIITPARLSYGILAATIILAGLLHLGVPLLVVLFSYFALRQLYFLTKRKWLALILFGIVVAGIAAAAVYFTRAAILALPDVADTSIPSASAWAQKRQIELPFTDFEFCQNHDDGDRFQYTRHRRRREPLLQDWA